jgi:hypothetical protein
LLPHSRHGRGTRRSVRASKKAAIVPSLGDRSVNRAIITSAQTGKVTPLMRMIDESGHA